ncbi:MAG: DNA polymerase III subunit beta [Absicoccus porci]|uniref:DNA polymerase III subunit beta n=1 Tax=Absicoccus porci TaxID=2486576 RepID=UPI002E782236|nr:DNA polymerase III subunit beta [Absicoccus porci]MEE1354360.1 DNA polymerase III subunit beta [Absicoccus porci]
MKFTIDRKYFYNQLSIVSRAISSFSPLPALSGICINVQDDHIVLTGSDSNISIRTYIYKGEENQLQIASTGSIVLESRYLLEIIHKIESTIVELEVMDFELVRITSTNGKFNLNGMEASQYPNIDFDQPSNMIELSKDTLSQIVSQTAFACSENDQRPVLSGVNFSAKDGYLYCSGTDSYRLARKTITLNENANFNITIPSKSLQEVVRSLSEDIDKVQLYIDSKKAQFVFGKTIFQTRLLDGTFPSVEKIIPTSSVASMVVDAHELASVIDRTNFIRNDKVHLVKLECSPEIVRIKTNSTEIGSSDEVLTDCMYKGDNLTLTCNGSYILDAIRALSGSKVDLEFSGDMRPIRILNPEDDSIVIVVVPVRSYD